MVAQVRQFLFGVLGLGLVLMLMPTSSAEAQSGRLRLRASVPGMKAVVKYEERGTNRKFNFQLELATPGKTGRVSAVAANGSTVVMGTFRVDALRRGIVDIDTKEGDDVADLNPGTVITVQYNGKTYTTTLQ